MSRKYGRYSCNCDADVIMNDFISIRIHKNTHELLMKLKDKEPIPASQTRIGLSEFLERVLKEYEESQQYSDNKRN